MPDPSLCFHILFSYVVQLWEAKVAKENIKLQEKMYKETNINNAPKVRDKQSTAKDKKKRENKLKRREEFINW